MSVQVYANGVLIEEWDDTTRTYTDHRTGTSRPYTGEENTAADTAAEQDALLTDLEARVAALEAHVYGTPDAPTDTATVPEWAALGGIWPPQGLLRDAGTVWRNISGVPLTTPPSGFPGTTGQWAHLFVEVTTTDPDPDPDPTPTYPAWSKDATYKVGDKVTHNGHVWQCLVAHGPEYQGTWAPGVAPTIWADLGQNGA